MRLRITDSGLLIGDGRCRMLFLDLGFNKFLAHVDDFDAWFALIFKKIVREIAVYFDA